MGVPWLVSVAKAAYSRMRLKLLRSHAAAFALLGLVLALIAGVCSSTETAPANVTRGSCVDLPRNTVLASCPAPCLEGAPCIIYDQYANHTKLTGCDYDTAPANSFCWSNANETCEFHCFPKSTDGSFTFLIQSVGFWGDQLRDRSPEDPLLLQTEALSIQSRSFVNTIGKLVLPKEITSVVIDGQYDTDVDPAILSGAPSVTSFSLSGVEFNTSESAALIASAPVGLESLAIQGVSLPTISWELFSRLPKLNYLSVGRGKTSSFTGSTTTMPALTQLECVGVDLNHFELRAPNLELLNLRANKLAHIPEGVFSSIKLQNLNLLQNPLVRPLVLTAEQLQFLEALPTLTITLIDPPDDELVSRLLTNVSAIYGNYSDSVDLSELLEGTNETLLRRNPLLPVRVVDSEAAAMYNAVLEKRVAARGLPSPDAPGEHVPKDTCQGVPRNSLLSNCVEGYCPTNGACVAYDQHSDFSLLSGCDYDMASTRSACTFPTDTATCEFQCFGAYRPQSQFKFSIPFDAQLGIKMQRHVIDPDLTGLTTTEIPFLSNVFVTKIGALKLTSAITEVWISGGRSEKSSRGRVADVVVSSDLLKNAPSVTSLSLLNIDLTKSDVAGIMASSSQGLKALTLRNTKQTALDDNDLANSQQLQTLTLAQNDITTVDIKATTVPKLTALDVSDNSLTTITVNAPNLKTLDLSTNDLVRIPLSVFSLTKLDTLILTNNPIAFPLVLSPSQAAFLTALPSLSLPSIQDPESNPASSTPSSSATPSSTASLTPTGTATTSPGSGSSTTLSPSAASTSTSMGTNSSPQTSGSVGARSVLVANGGKSAVVRGIPVIIVSDQVANQYNDQLEKLQQQAIAASRSQSSGSGSTTGSRSRTSTQPSQRNATTSAGYSRDGSLSTDSTASGSGEGQQSETNRSTVDVGGSDLSAAGGKNKTPATTPSASASNVSVGMSLSTKLMLGGFGVAFFVLLLVVLLILCKRRSRGAEKTSTYIEMVETVDASSGLSTNGTGTQIVAWWRDDVLLSHRLNAGDLGDVRAIGSGESGTVLWLVNYRAGSRQLVSKRLIQGEGPPHDARMLQLITEAKIASTLEYPSIVRFVGVAWTDKTDLQVLYEYMPNGDLGSYLASTDVAALPWGREKLQFVIDIIEALVYTHSFNPPVLHRNLKASNVLLDDKGKAKLSDFASARPESESNTMTTRGVGSGRWLAPEILSGSTSYGASSDIYSFGVVLCELDTHREPYAEEAVTIPETELLQRVARGELRPSLSASCPPEIREIAEACLALDPESRPNAMQVSHQLRSLRKNKK